MRSRWSITKLIAVGSLAVLDIVVGLAASVITTTTGITMASGVITSLSEPLLLMVCLLTVDRRWTGLLFMSIVGLLALPLNYAGPPGFLAKLPIILVLGLVCDLLFQLMRRLSIWGTAVVIGGYLCLWYAFAVALVGRLLRVPGIDNFLSVMPLHWLVLSVFVVGAVGGCLGVWVYNRIKNTTVVLRIQGS